MADTDRVWQRDGSNIEDLPDPFIQDAPCEAEPPSRPSRRWWRWGFNAISLLILATVLWLVVTAPLSRSLEPLPVPATLFVSAEGKPIARRGAVKEEPVVIAELEPQTSQAFVAIEDRRFYRHWGIDPRSIGRAMVANFRAGGVRQGGSTITQQLAKTSFLSSDRSFRRKAQEVIIAFWLEAWLSKDDILARYLSSVYFGDGVYGLRAAARHYFGREPEKLSLAQSAMLAGMVQAPSRLAPTRNLAGAQKRSRLVLKAMADSGFITASRAAATRPARPLRNVERIPTGTYFADWIAPRATADLDGEFGEVRVPTTLDVDLQRVAVRAISRATIGGAQAALVAMRPDGRVVAMVGGKSYKVSPFNRATQARRQPGSAFKLFVYLAALRAGYTPQSLIEDKPIDIDGWSPANSDGVYRGTITLREAFARSSNAAAVRLAERVGRNNVIRAARDLGISAPLPNSPSVSLGTAGMSLIEMTAAYAAVAGGTYPVRAYGLPPREGRESFGNLLGRGARLDEDRDRLPLLDLLWSAANEGTGRRASLRVPTFGKTGTSQGNRDALFIGFAGNLVVGVWVGRDDDQSLGRITGGTAPAQIWRNFMSSALSIDGTTSKSLPDGYRPPTRQRRDTSPIPPGWRIPPEWVEPEEEIRQIINQVEDFLGRL